MKEIDESYLLEKRTDEESYVFVFYNMKGCESCERAKIIIESVENNFPEIEFVSLSVKNMLDISTFAPIALPSFLLFIGGYRVRETNAQLASRIQLIEIIKQWVL